MNDSGTPKRRWNDSYLPWVHLDIAHMGNCVQTVCEFNMSLLLYACLQLMFALLLVPFF